MEDTVWDTVQHSGGIKEEEVRGRTRLMIVMEM